MGQPKSGAIRQPRSQSRADSGATSDPGSTANEAERLLEYALRQSRSWVWETGPDLVFTRFVGPRQENIGAPAHEGVGKRFGYLLAERSGVVARDLLKRLERREAFTDLVYRLKTPDGMHTVRTSGQPRFAAGGEFLGYTGTSTDITAESEAQQQADDTMRRFVEALEHIPASIMLCDADDRIVFCNSATRNYFPTATHLC